MSPEKNYYSNARKYYDAGDFTSAVEAFGKAIEAEPRNADFYSERGVAFFHLGKLHQSLQDMNRSQEIEPQNPYRYSSRAYIRDAMGDTRGAIEDYKLAIKLDPEDAIAHNNLGLLEEKLGYKEQAKKRYSTADQLAAEQKLFGEARHEQQLTGAPAAPEDQSMAGEIKKVFTTKKGFKEFLQFLKKGFK